MAVELRKDAKARVDAVLQSIAWEFGH